MAPSHTRPTDNAFRGQLKGGSLEPTYGGALSFMRRRYTRDLKGVDLAVLGIPFDSAVSNRPGARLGPQAIRHASAAFDGDPQYPFGFDLFEELIVIDYGDVGFDFGHPGDAASAVAAEAAAILDSGAKLFALGGDHFVTWPLLKAHAAKHGKLALVQFDAHQDTWDDDGERIDHGTFVLRAVREGLIDPARSIQVGIRTQAPQDCGIAIVPPSKLDEVGVAGVIDTIGRRVGAGPAYLTFDIDCLDPAFAPGTGTPVAGGLSSREALAILRGIGGLDLVGGDVVEVSPPFDHADVTALAAATVAMYFIGGLAEKKRA